MVFSLRIGSFRMSYGQPPRPTVYLVRHGQSRSNVDRNVHNELPDPLIQLSELGQQQARIAGEALGQHLLANGNPRKVRIFHSEYLRAEQTCQGLLTTLRPLVHAWGCQMDDRADSRIHELEFGWVSGMTDEERQSFSGQLGNAAMQSKLLRDHDAKWFDRRLGGESPADVEVRLRHFFSALYRDLEDNDITHFIVVSHGLTNRVFAKAWLGENFRWYAKEKNPRNCAIRYLPASRTDGGYIHFGGYEGIGRESELTATEDE
jgi:broad specificity phosphatase PhoE